MADISPSARGISESESDGNEDGEGSREELDNTAFQAVSLHRAEALVHAGEITTVGEFIPSPRALVSDRFYSCGALAPSQLDVQP